MLIVLESTHLRLLDGDLQNVYLCLAGCLLYKEGRFEEALAKFNGSQQIVGYDPHLSYNVALCHYRSGR